MTTSETEATAAKSEIRDGMRIDWDVPIPMDDGIVLRADVFRPVDELPAPVLLTYGPYCKGLRLSDHHPYQWQKLLAAHPEVMNGSTGKYQAWEVPDPEKWIPNGYACVRVDSRGAGRSPGYIEPHSPREIRDASSCIDWAGGQTWCNGNVGILGISYYADSAWLVASLEDPSPHLKAICLWEGSADQYRDVTHHGGILTTFAKNWWTSRILPIQHGVGERGHTSPNTGELASGPETLSEEELAANRTDIVRDFKSHPLDDDWTRVRSAKWENVKIAVLSAGNWGGQALHLRGNVEGFVRAATQNKWLEMHGREHWTLFYSDYGIDIQKRFFDCFLRGDDSGWVNQPRVLLNVRRPGEHFERRAEEAWPLPDTQWTPVHLDAAGRALGDKPAGSSAAISFDATGPGVTFMGPQLEDEIEITGPIAAKLSISSSTTDADIFLVFHVFDEAGKEVTFQGSMEPLSCVGKGWLRASHRKLDPNLTLEYRPYHTHDEVQPLVPGQIYSLDIEVWPTCIQIPKGYRYGLTVLGRDFFHEDKGVEYDNFGQSAGRNGSGPMIHDDPDDRPLEIFGGTTTIHFGPECQNSLLLPVIPPREQVPEASPRH